MQCTTSVEGEWLAELGPMFLSVKKIYKSRLPKRAKEKTEKLDMEHEMTMQQERDSFERTRAPRTRPSSPCASMCRSGCPCAELDLVELMVWTGSRRAEPSSKPRRRCARRIAIALKHGWLQQDTMRDDLSPQTAGKRI